MSFIDTYNRADLQQMQAKHRKQQLCQHIDNSVAHGVLHSAREGKTQYFWANPVPRHHIGGNPYPAPSHYTNDELIGALKEKFPGTKVEYQETWIETRPGVMEQKKGILIDWS